MELVIKILALISGLLVSSDLIMSKDTMTHINLTLRNWLKLSTIRKTFIVSVIVAIVGMAGWITYLILKDSNNILRNIRWLPMFSIGFVVGLAILLLLTYSIIKFLRRDQAWSIAIGGAWLGILTVIIFVIAVKSTGNSPFMNFALGLFYGVAAVDISFHSSKFLTWFLTTDPNPDPGRNPRVLARIGLLLFIIAGIVGIIDFFIE